jgi:AmiR/NasT family two-component response regulator
MSPSVIIVERPRWYRLQRQLKISSAHACIARPIQQLRLGAFTKEALQRRAETRELYREVRKLLKEID